MSHLRDRATRFSSNPRSRDSARVLKASNRGCGSDDRGAESFGESTNLDERYGHGETMEAYSREERSPLYTETRLEKAPLRSPRSAFQAPRAVMGTTFKEAGINQQG